MMIQPQIDFCCFRLVAINIALTHCYKLVSFLNLILVKTAFGSQISRPVFKVVQVRIVNKQEHYGAYKC